MTDRTQELTAPPASGRVSELGFAPMDRIHAELDVLLLRAQAPGPPQWAQLLGDVHAHLKEHFEAEDRWMRDSDFPPRECHMDEHAAVLRSSEEVLALAQRGEFGPAPSFLAELSRWFPAHADHLDSALAAWMCKRQYGGKPVVVHRAQRHGSEQGGMVQGREHRSNRR